jgi:hypothetical protein
MILDKLKKKPSDLILLIAALIGIVILLTINIMIFEVIARRVPVYTILDFEFAWNEVQAELILNTWDVLGRGEHAAGVYWDFLYILGYVVPLCTLIVYFSRRLEDRIATIGLYMSLTPIVAGIFDLIENINLLIMLNETPNFESFVPLMASISATIKFGSLIVGAIVFLIALVLFIIKKIKKED